MNIREAIRTRRTIRKYKQERIPPEVLEELVEGARLAPSATNRQPLEYLAVEDPSLLEPVFGTLGWAGYIRPHGTPKEGEKPAAYIVILIKREFDDILAKYDIGAAAENILLGALEYGIGGCMIGTSDMYEYAATAIGPMSSLCPSFIARKMDVGPSAPPIMLTAAA